MLNLILMNREGLVRGVKAGDSLGYSDYEIVEFSILHEGSRTASKIATLDFWRVNFSFFGDLFGRINPMGTGPAGKKSPREMITIQALLPLGSRTVHPSVKTQ